MGSHVSYFADHRHSSHSYELSSMFEVEKPKAYDGIFTSALEISSSVTVAASQSIHPLFTDIHSLKPPAIASVSHETGKSEVDLVFDKRPETSNAYLDNNSNGCITASTTLGNQICDSGDATSLVKSEMAALEVKEIMADLYLSTVKETDEVDESLNNDISCLCRYGDVQSHCKICINGIKVGSKHAASDNAIEKATITLPDLSVGKFVTEMLDDSSQRTCEGKYVSSTDASNSCYSDNAFNTISAELINVHQLPPGHFGFDFPFDPGSHFLRSYGSGVIVTISVVEVIKIVAASPNCFGMLKLTMGEFPDQFLVPAIECIRDTFVAAISKTFELIGARMVFWDMRESLVFPLFQAGVGSAPIPSQLDEFPDEPCALTYFLWVWTPEIYAESMRIKMFEQFNCNLRRAHCLIDFVATLFSQVPKFPMAGEVSAFNKYVPATVLFVSSKRLAWVDEFLLITKQPSLQNFHLIVLNCIVPNDSKNLAYTTLEWWDHSGSSIFFPCIITAHFAMLLHISYSDLHILYHFPFDPGVNYLLVPSKGTMMVTGVCDLYYFVTNGELPIVEDLGVGYISSNAKAYGLVTYCWWEPMWDFIPHSKELMLKDFQRVHYLCLWEVGVSDLSTMATVPVNVTAIKDMFTEVRCSNSTRTTIILLALYDGSKHVFEIPLASALQAQLPGTIGELALQRDHSTWINGRYGLLIFNSCKLCLILDAWDLGIYYKTLILMIPKEHAVSSCMTKVWDPGRQWDLAQEVGWHVLLDAWALGLNDMAIQIVGMKFTNFFWSFWLKPKGPTKMAILKRQRHANPVMKSFDSIARSARFLLPIFLIYHVDTFKNFMLLEQVFCTVTDDECVINGLQSFSILHFVVGRPHQRRPYHVCLISMLRNCSDRQNHLTMPMQNTKAMLLQNLEDKVLNTGGGNVMNMDGTYNAYGSVIRLEDCRAIGPGAKSRRGQTIKQPNKIFVWDPGGVGAHD